MVACMQLNKHITLTISNYIGNSCGCGRPQTLSIATIGNLIIEDTLYKTAAAFTRKVLIHLLYTLGQLLAPCRVTSLFLDSLHTVSSF